MRVLLLMVGYGMHTSRLLMVGYGMHTSRLGTHHKRQHPEIRGAENRATERIH